MAMHSEPMRPGAVISPRSILVVPGHVERMHAKALQAGADEIVLDLEDAVRPADKPSARQHVHTTLLSDQWRDRRVAVRINPVGSEYHDIDLELCAAIAARRGSLSVVVPKVEGADELQAIAANAGARVRLQALIETPHGLLAASAIALVDCVESLILGYADLGAALGRRGDDDWRVHQELVLASARAAGIAAIDGPYFKLRDERGLLAAASAVRAMGFHGKWAVHPSHVEPINHAFAATVEERDWAEHVIAELDRAGAATVDGAMVDEAMARQARRLLAMPSPPREPKEADGRSVGAPYYDDLARGDVFRSPGLTIGAGHAALHQAVVGDRLRLTLDAELFEAVAGCRGLLAHPMLVCDVAIGQSTQASGRVLGNLFYRGLGCRPIPLGTTLRTRTEVAARRAASRGRGLVALRVSTEDSSGRPILDFWRCPLLPRRPGRPVDVDEGDDDLVDVGAQVDAAALVPQDWTLDALRVEALGPLFDDLRTGDRFVVEAAETVTSAPELARLTLNVAMTHTDARAGVYGRRLVYGGHVIGIAAAHITRGLPDLATLLAWESCDHLGPVFEGDRLQTRVMITRLEPLADGGLVSLRAQVMAAAGAGTQEPARDVLDWRLVALMP